MKTVQIKVSLRRQKMENSCETFERINCIPAKKADTRMTSCEFCSQSFFCESDRNAHLLEHFAREFCAECDKQLIRIGDALYVLHSKLTCIKSETFPDEYEPIDEPNVTAPIIENEIIIKEERIDETFAENIFVEPLNTDYDATEELSKNEAISEDDEEDEHNEQSSFFSDEQEAKLKRQKAAAYQQQIIECDFEGCGEMIKRHSKTDHMRKHLGITFPCPICKKTFAKRMVLNSHMKTHDGSKRVTCEECGMSLAHKNSLKIHRLKLHTRQEDAKDVENHKEKVRQAYLRSKSQLIKCEICDKVVTKTRYWFHMKVHEDKQYICEYCNGVFKSKFSLSHHMKLHNPGREREKCPSCDATFSNKHNLERHERTVHLNEPKRFICTVCGKAFRGNKSLKTHMYVHTGERPFACQYPNCGKSFRSSDSKKEHQRVHTGERPYKCDQEGCNRDFAYNIDMRRHKIKVHGIWFKKFTCQICSQDFPENMLLMKHMEVHNIETLNRDVK